jgi:hypothetical protein
MDVSIKSSTLIYKKIRYLGIQAVSGSVFNVWKKRRNYATRKKNIKGVFFRIPRGDSNRC